MIAENPRSNLGMSFPSSPNGLARPRSGVSVASCDSFGEGRLGLLVKLPGYALFLMMLCLLTTYPQVKLPLLIITIGICLVAANQRKGFGLHHSVVSAIQVIVWTGFAFSLLGAFYDTVGWWRCSTVYVFWPIVYAVILGGGLRNDILRDIVRLLAIALIFVAGYSIIHVLHGLGYYPSQLYFEIAEEQQEIGAGQGYVRYNLCSISSIVFLVPFAISALIAWPADRKNPVGRVLLLSGTVLGLAAAVLTGRRALWLVIAASPLITWGVMWFLPGASISRKMGKLILLVAVFAFCLAASLYPLMTYMDVTSDGLWDGRMRDVVAITTGESDDLRVDQFWGLLEGWAEKPLLGHGLGAQIGTMIRDDERPWSYELSYLTLLAQTGLIGFAVYALFVRWIYKMGIAVIRSGGEMGRLMLPVLVALTCFLIANATNPYLAKFDGLWVLFLPLGIINDWLLDRQQDRAHRRPVSPTLVLGERP